MEKLVDVIIPTYKRADHLEKTIESLLKQSYKNIKIIIVDDNDPQSEWRKMTLKKMSKYEMNKNIMYICHEKNKNGSAARNTGFKFSTGKYVCFLDDDDYFYEEKIEKQVKYLEKNNNIDACFCDYEKNGVFYILENKGDFSYDILLGNLTPQTSGIMFKRDVIAFLNGFDESYYRHQDYELLLRFYNHFKMGKVKGILYRRDKTEIDNNPDGRKLEQLKLKMLKQFNYKIQYLKKRDRNFEKKVIIYNYIDILKSYLKQGDYKNSIRIIEVIFRASCFFSLIILLKQFFFYLKHTITRRE